MKKKILLIGLNYIGYNSLSLAFLKSYALKNPEISNMCDIKIIDFCYETELPNSILYEIINEKPYIIGFSCYSWNVDLVTRLCKNIKLLCSKTTIIIGGPEVSCYASEYLEKNKFADIIVEGEGEITFSELLSSYLTNDNIEKTRGIIYRDNNGKINANPTRELISNLDDIPSPYLTGVIDIAKIQRLTLESTRGCPFNCNYCVEGNKYMGIRFFSLERIRQEIEYAAENNIRNISFMFDSIANPNNKRFEEFCMLLKELQYKHNVFYEYFELFPSDITDNLVSIMKQAKMLNVQLGLQTINEYTLKNCNRPVCSESKFAKIVKTFNKNGFNVIIFVIIGLPGDNFYKSARTILFSLSLKSHGLTINTLRILPGTSFQKNAEKFDLKYSEHPPYFTLSNYSFSFDELIRAELLGECIEKEFNMSYNLEGK
ncbi:MAG: radical SAM protein [archaeon]